MSRLQFAKVRVELLLDLGKNAARGGVDRDKDGAVGSYWSDDMGGLVVKRWQDGGRVGCGWLNGY